MKLGLLAISFCLILAVSACGPSAAQRAALTATAATATAAAWTSTPTLTPTTTPTQTATATATSTPTLTPSPTVTLNPDLYYALDNSFTLMAPKGWLPADAQTDYPALKGPLAGNYAPNLTFFEDQSRYPMAFYSAIFQDRMQEQLTAYRQLKEEFLTTATGQDYFRWELEHTRGGAVFHQILYFYESGDWKLVITYTRLRSQGPKNDALIDAAMQTVQFTH
jgi:hypothetical protein